MSKAIDEGNKLIDIFVHPQYTIIGDWIHWNDDNGSKNHVSVLQYHSSWNSLMPVVERIRNDHFVNIEMYGSFVCVWITKDKDLPTIEQKIYSEHPSAITATWAAVVQFIQWYNQSKI